MTTDRVRLAAALGLGPAWRARQPMPMNAVAPSASSVIAGTDTNADATTAVGTATNRLADGLADGALDWAALAMRVKSCERCGLCRSRKQTVFGVGPENARLMIVGEAPGQEEDLRGEPFVGQAGKLLDNMLSAVGLNREQHVFIANVLKCRPPGNRNPEPEEVAACSPYLRRQVELLRPDLILVMGRFAAQTMVGSDASIASLRGRRHHYAMPDRQVPMIVTYHPAYLLRNLPDKAKAWTDLLLLTRLLREAAA